MFNKKAQAAMEFLMTYGWAILVVLVAIGALAYFGVLSPDKFLPEQAQGPAGLDVIDKAAIDLTAGTVTLGIKNNLGYDITFTANASEPTSGNQDCTVEKLNVDPENVANLDTFDDTGASTVYGAVSLSNGEKAVLTFTCASISETRFKSDLTTWYIQDPSNLHHPATFYIAGRAS
jgi:uncharacterized protein (UPF0333 family)